MWIPINPADSTYDGAIVSNLKLFPGVFAFQMLIIDRKTQTVL